MKGMQEKPKQLLSTLEILNSFDTDRAGMARAFANGNYSLWLGSGISRSVVPGVGDLLERVLCFLQGKADQPDRNCRFGKALNEVLEMADLSEDERKAINLAQSPKEWPRELLGKIITQLSSQYSAVLDVRVEGEEPGFLVWEGIDVEGTYGSETLEPATEHLCVALLVLEGVVHSIQTTNWDGLIEKAIGWLAGGEVDKYLQVVVAREEFRRPFTKTAARTLLLKFHGCAVKALECPTEFRDLIVARKSQISKWREEPRNATMKKQLEILLSTKSSLFVGLSAQDRDIQAMIHQSSMDLPRRWPDSPPEPPAMVFADVKLSPTQIAALKAAYGEDYESNREAIDSSALLNASAEPLLVALVLFVIADKLCLMITRKTGLSFDDANFKRLQDDVRALRNRAARQSEGSKEEVRAFVCEFIKFVSLALSTYREGSPPEPHSILYNCLSVEAIENSKSDTNFPQKKLGRLAVAVSLFSRGLAEEAWEVEIGYAARPELGTFRLVLPCEIRLNVFIIEDEVAFENLKKANYADMGDPNVILIHASRIYAPPYRSPSVNSWRTDETSACQIDLASMCERASDANNLYDEFRVEIGSSNG